MEKIKIWKRLMAIALSTALLVPAPAISAAEKEQTEQNPQTREADENGFVIENGVLKEYTGSGGEVLIPADVTSIGVGAFSNHTGLTKVEIPSSVTSIEKYAFSGCSSLTDVTIPSSVINIGESAFSRCSGLGRCAKWK